MKTEPVPMRKGLRMPLSPHGVTLRLCLWPFFFIAGVTLSLLVEGMARTEAKMC